MSTNALRQRWREASPVVGAWCVTGSPLTAELMAAAGYDYVGVDCQHGLIDYSSMVPVLQALARHPGVTPIVRVASNDNAAIGKALDAGAEAVVVPMVNTPDDAATAAAACRYSPQGIRSFGPVRAGLFLGTEPAIVNAEVACLVMIETIGAVGLASEICSTRGVDGVYIGPADLAVSMGISPAHMASASDHMDAMDVVRRACQRAGIVAGIHATDVESARHYLSKGFDMVTISSDARLIRSAAVTALTAIRGHETHESATEASAAGAGYA